MKNIKIETNHVRVIGNTRSPDATTMNELIGQELEVAQSDYHDETIAVWNEAKSNYYYFKKSDVRFLTPAKFNGNYIAIDDEVFVGSVWEKVLGFYMYDNEIRITTGIPKNTHYYLESVIEDHRTNTETKMTIAQIEEKLNITRLKIIE